MGMLYRDRHRDRRFLDRHAMSPGAGYCHLEIWPLYDGKNITVAFTDDQQGDESKDLLIVDLSHDEARALADMLISAAKCETDSVTYSLRVIALRGK